MRIHEFLSFFLLISLNLIWSSHGYNFSVGGKDGWVLNPSENFNNWAGRNRFQVNDSLVFNYKKGEDSVLVVSREDYDKCNTKNPKTSYNDGSSVFKFDRSGSFYFISGTPGKCGKGQKLIVVVLAVRQKAGSNTPPISPSLPPKSSKSPPPSSSLSPSPSSLTSPPSPSPTSSPSSPSPTSSPSSPSSSPSTSPSSPSSSPTSSPSSPSSSPTSSPSSPSTSPSSPSPSTSATSPSPLSSPSPSSSTKSPSPSPSPSSSTTSPSPSTSAETPTFSPALTPSQTPPALGPPSSTTPPTTSSSSETSPPAPSPPGRSAASPPMLSLTSGVSFGVAIVVVFDFGSEGVMWLDFDWRMAVRLNKRMEMSLCYRYMKGSGILSIENCHSVRLSDMVWPLLFWKDT
ncbi:hypothetical protein AAC387_Pa12g2140 [Persea americana]